MLKAEMFDLNGGEFINLGESSIANERYVIRFPSNYGIDIAQENYIIVMKIHMKQL